METLDSLIKEPPEGEALEIESLWVEAAYHSGKLEQARDMGLRILPDLEDDADFVVMMIQLLGETGDYQKAYDVYKHGIENSPQNEALRKLGDGVADRSKRGRMEALKSLDDRRELTAAEHFEKAELHREFNQLQQAIVHY